MRYLIQHKFLLFAGAILFALFTMIQPVKLTAQSTRLTPEKLWALGRISDPQVSPDGNWVLYGVTKYNIRENNSKRTLYITSLKTGDTRVVRDLAGSAYNARWRPDGKKIGFLSAKSGSMQLWEMNINGDELMQVTSFDLPIDNFDYAPDMKHISFTMNIKLDQSVADMYPDLPKANAKIINDLMYRHWDQWKGETYSHVCIIKYEDGKVIGAIKDVMKDEKYDCPMKPFDGPEDIAWSPDGNSLAYVCKKYTGKEYAINTNSDIYWYDIPSGVTIDISKDNQGYDLLPSFSPDGTKIAWLSMLQPGHESAQHEIKIFDVKTGGIKLLTENFDRDIVSCSWDKNNKILYFIACTDGTQQVYTLDLGSTVFEKIDEKKADIKPLTRGAHDITSIQPIGHSLIAGVMSMSEPERIYSIETNDGTMQPLTHVNDSIWDPIQKGKVEKRIIKTIDGKNMLVWIIYPPDFNPQRKYPCLLYCQGGPQSQVSQFFSYRWNFQIMAANGYVIVAPNRRGLPGFGAEWNNEISGDWGGLAMKDYLTAIDSVSVEPYIDRSNLGAVGASFGGYSVYYLAGIHNNRFKAFIAHDGIFDIQSWYGSTEEMFFANWDLNGPYWNDPQPVSYTKFSPINFVRNWNTPMLIVQGGRDYRVPDTQAFEAFNALQLRGIPSKLLYFPDENHWVTSPQDGILWQRVFFDWLDKWLKN